MRVHGPDHPPYENHPNAQRVTVAIYKHEHGDDVRVFASEAAAEEWRQEIALEYWDDLFSEPMSADLDEAADRYFERCADVGLEFFSTQTAEVEI
jgi:hypothetical protein